MFTLKTFIISWNDAILVSLLGTLTVGYVWAVFFTDISDMKSLIHIIYKVHGPKLQDYHVVLEIKV